VFSLINPSTGFRIAFTFYNSSPVKILGMITVIVTILLMACHTPHAAKSPFLPDSGPTCGTLRVKHFSSFEFFLLSSRVWLSSLSRHTPAHTQVTQTVMQAEFGYNHTFEA